MTRLWDNLRRLITEGHRRQRDREQGLELLLKMIVAPPTREQAVNWKRDASEGSRAYRLRCRQLYSFSRTLVENWLDDEPVNAKARQWLDELRAWAEREDPSAAPVYRPICEP